MDTASLPRTKNKKWSVIAVAALISATASGVVVTGSPAAAAPGSPAVRPPLGWNSWNTFGCDISEAKIRAAADAMVSSGMRAAGYEYVVVDDCWQATTRTEQATCARIR